MNRCIRFKKLLLLCLASLAGAALISAEPRAAAEGGVRGSAQADVRPQSDQDEKESRTPAQRKLDSQLLHALRQRRGQTRGGPAETVRLELDEKGRVLVDVTARVTPRVLSKIQKLGGTIVSKSERFHAVRARLPLERLEALASLDDVRRVIPAAVATTNGGALND